MEYISLEDIDRAYKSCRRSKRRKNSSLEYELNYELYNYQLYLDLNNKTYKPSKSMAFCVRRPLLREIFAAQFRDRIVHHLIIQKLNSAIEDKMIDSSFACRKGKGTYYGINKVNQMLTDISDNYTKEAWTLRGDIQGFFMSINTDILLDMLIVLIKNTVKDNTEWWIWLVTMIVKNRPEDNCYKTGNLSLWDKIPDNKTLFKSNGKGLPIGNYTSQVFANLYLSEFDKTIKQIVGSDGEYGRGADDFIVIHKSRKTLVSLRKYIKIWLKKNLDLNLHPYKSTLQHVLRGVKFLGAFIKQGVLYPTTRAIYNAFAAIRRWNIYKTHSEKHIDKFIHRMNSYFGFLRQGKSYKIRKRLLLYIKDIDGIKSVDNIKITKI